MNVWRWFGLSFFLIGAVCLLGTTKFPSFAVAQDKKTSTATKTDDKKSAAPAKKTEEPKKTEAPKKTEEPKKTETPPSGAKLQFKAFDPKSKFFQVMKTVTKQDMTVSGQTIKQNQEQTFVIEWEGKDKKGNDYVVAQTIRGIEMEINIGGNKIAFSSRKEEPKNPMTEFFNQLKNTPLTYVISPDLKVQSVENAGDFIKKLGDINPQMQSLLKVILSEDALKKMAEPTWMAYPPDGDLSKKTWTKESKLSLGPIGSYDTKFTFTNNGEKDGKVEIGIDSTVTYTAPTDAKGLPFVITNAKLTSTSGKGKAIFDKAKGRFEKSDLTMKLEGKLSIEVSNMTAEVTLNQEQTATSETFDANPWEKK
jgi:hypothetical protein